MADLQSKILRHHMRCATPEPWPDWLKTVRAFALAWVIGVFAIIGGGFFAFVMMGGTV